MKDSKDIKQLLKSKEFKKILLEEYRKKWQEQFDPSFFCRPSLLNTVPTAARKETE